MRRIDYVGWVFAMILIFGLCNQVRGEDNKTNLDLFKSQKDRMRFIERMVESWEYAAIHKLSSKGDDKLVTKFRGGVAPRSTLLGKGDYKFYSKLDGMNGDLFYLLLIFKTKQEVDRTTATNRVKISKRIVILGWDSYKKDPINLSSLTVDNQGDGFCTVEDLVRAGARLNKGKKTTQP